MKKPRLKRNRTPKNYISSTDFPVDVFLRDCPLPPELKHVEPAIRGPVGKSLLAALTTCRGEGFSFAQLEDVARQVVAFYAQEYHRCTSCFDWTNDFAAGAVVIDGQFKITVVCAKCGRLVASGRATESMERNMAEFVLGGEK